MELLVISLLIVHQPVDKIQFQLPCSVKVKFRQIGISVTQITFQSVFLFKISGCIHGPTLIKITLFDYSMQRLNNENRNQVIGMLQICNGQG